MRTIEVVTAEGILLIGDPHLSSRRPGRRRDDEQQEQPGGRRGRDEPCSRPLCVSLPLQNSPLIELGCNSTVALPSATAL